MVLKVASPALICAASCRRPVWLATGNGKAAHVVDQVIAFVLVHVQPVGGEAGKAWVRRLVTAGDLEAHFAGGGGEDELFERCRLRLPSKAADTPILEAAHSPLDAGPSRKTSASRRPRSPRRVWRRSGPLRTEEAGSAPSSGSDRPVPAGHRLAPGVVRGVGPVAVQHHAARLLEAGMNRRQESGVGSMSRCARRLGTITDAILEPSCSEVHAEGIGEARVIGRGRRGRDDFDISVDLPAPPVPPRLWQPTHDCPLKTGPRPSPPWALGSSSRQTLSNNSRPSRSGLSEGDQAERDPESV